MEKGKYANTVRINALQDGRVVLSLYVNDSKDNKEYFKAAARVRTAAAKGSKRRKVTVTKTEKTKHREKRMISSYLEANQWEYVLSVPAGGKDCAAVWKKFKNKYGYRYKERPLQYLMIKQPDGLYGVISNAAVEGEKIPLIDVEHMVVGAFDVSMIDSLSKMSLRYECKGKEKSYVSSQHLNKKRYEFVNLDGIEYFELPDNAIVTKGQASLVFNGGTAEENMAAARRFMAEKKVENVAEEHKKFDNVAELTADAEAMKDLQKSFESQVDKATNNDFIKNVGVYGFGSSEFEYKHSVNQHTNSIIFAAMQNGTVVWCADWLVKEKKWSELKRWNVFPTVYYWQNIETGELIYVGLSATPLTRHTDHLARNGYSEENRREDGVYDRYMQCEGVTADKLKALYLPVGWYKEKTEYTHEKEIKTLFDGQSPKIPYITLNDYNEFEKAEARLQRKLIHGWKKGVVRTDIFLGENHSDVLEAERVFGEQIKAGKNTKKAVAEAARGKDDRLKKYLRLNAEYLENENKPLEKCMEWWGFFFSTMMQTENKNGFVQLDVIAELIRKNRVGLEDLQLNVLNSKPETKEQRTKRKETLEQIFKKENEKAQIDGWVNEFD